MLYVTDYTTRDELAPIAATIGPTGLTDAIVKIFLFDKQAETANDIKPKDFIGIRNLRLKKDPQLDHLSGRLGGSQRLITKLHPNSGSDELNALLR